MARYLRFSQDPVEKVDGNDIVDWNSVSFRLDGVGMRDFLVVSLVEKPVSGRL